MRWPHVSLQITTRPGSASLVLPLALAIALGGAAPLSAREPSPQPGAARGARGEAREDPPTYVGEDVCAGCHRQEAAHWNDTVHADVFHRAGSGEPGARDCEACHGPGSAHASDPLAPANIVAFTRGSAEPVAEQNEVCLECHTAGARVHWRGSAHQVEGLGCSDCHNPMSRTSAQGLLREPTVSRTCFSCHPAQRADFRKRSHMPLLEGKLSCADCHQPHGSITDPLLRADSVNHLCTGCHPEKRGPFLWEHAPVSESCLNCHLPHGSNRDALLVMSPPFLCQECHAQLGVVNPPGALLSRANLAGGPRPDERLVNRGCVNCHAQIHGSNHPSGARFHR